MTTQEPRDGEPVAVHKLHVSLDEKISRRLDVFIAITIVAGLLLVVALGYESIRTQLVVDAAHQDLIDRSAATLLERKASCAYTKRFVAAFQKFESNQAIANSLEAPSSGVFDRARLYAFDTLFADLNQLGTDACKGTPQ